MKKLFRIIIDGGTTGGEEGRNWQNHFMAEPLAEQNGGIGRTKLF